jgi:hypothetical protein
VFSIAHALMQHINALLLEALLDRVSVTSLALHVTQRTGVCGCVCTQKQFEKESGTDGGSESLPRIAHPNNNPAYNLCAVCMFWIMICGFVMSLWLEREGGDG